MRSLVELIHEAYETLVSIQNKANLREGHSSQTPRALAMGIRPFPGFSGSFFYAGDISSLICTKEEEREDKYDNNLLLSKKMCVCYTAVFLADTCTMKALFLSGYLIDVTWQG